MNEAKSKNDVGFLWGRRLVLTNLRKICFLCRRQLLFFFHVQIIFMSLLESRIQHFIISVGNSEMAVLFIFLFILKKNPLFLV